MGVFKWNGNYFVDSVLKVLAIIALASFIICSVSWLVQGPNRYQLVVSSSGLVRIDTLTGRVTMAAPAHF